VWLLFCAIVQASSEIAAGPFCNSSLCGKTQTCCTDHNDSSGCCPLPHANCCGLADRTCCPQGSLCDPVVGGCARYVNDSHCQACQETVRYISEYGCGKVCSYVPPQAVVECLLIVKLGLCDSILNWLTSTGSPSLTMCSLTGFCSGGTCACSYCTRFTYGRCLSLPNRCPKRTAPPQPLSPQLPIRYTSNSTFCFNGVCNAAFEGCCLTCL